MMTAHATPYDLKQRIHDNEMISVAFGSSGMPLETVRKFRDAGHDMVFVDCQHQPIDEKELAQSCRLAADHDLPVALRIRHPDEAYLAGRYLDFGPLAIIVPMVEREETVERAIESFYYPPIGRRSWGPDRAYGWDAQGPHGAYADWWNAHGILMMQFESLAAVRAARWLAKAGVDMIVFGEQDLMLDIGAATDPPWRDFAACRAQVVEATAGLPVKIAASPSPIGHL